MVEEPQQITKKTITNYKRTATNNEKTAASNYKEPKESSSW